MKFSFHSKVLLFITLAAALLKCAQSPFILDNESYYLQTIKWLNEYGYVKGIANFNILLGQTSPWQILQSGFNFSFITDRINDINGFLLVICTFYFVQIFERHWTENNKIHWTSITLLFNVLSFQFINSPSPDLPIFLISQIIFYHFLKNNRSLDDIKIIILLLIFLCFIKITIVPLTILLLFIVYKNPNCIAFTCITVFIFSFLWIGKNAILTGYPLYPIPYYGLDVDYKVPIELINFISNIVQNHEFLQIPNYESLSFVQKFWIWINFSGINGIFNKGIIFLFLAIPFTNFFKQKKAKLLYAVILMHFILIYFASPQFRFFLPEIIFLSAILVAEILNRIQLNQQKAVFLLYLFILLPTPIIFIGNFKMLTDNKLNQVSTSFKLIQLVAPESNSRFSNCTFEKYTVGNLDYFSPKPNFFFYGTANGNLPCTNVNFINSFKEKFHLIPQLRTKHLNDGFRSIAIDTLKR